MNSLKNFDLVMLQEGVNVPMRSTTGSAGFDIFAPTEIVIPAGQSVTVELPFTFEGDINQDVMVRAFVRSSFGIKKKVRIVVDGKKNALGKKLNLKEELHTLTLLNDTNEDLTIQKNEHFAQLILSKNNPKEEKQSLEFLTEEQLQGVVPVKGRIEVVRPNVYDFVLDEEVVLAPHEQKVLPSGIRSVIEDGTWTAIIVHEDVTDKVMLANQIAVVDADYAYNEGTKGNCFLAMVNLTDEEVILPVGTNLTRWWTEKYYTFENEIKTDKIRTGGVGHTSK